MYSFCEINKNNKHYLTSFLSNELPDTFRYFKKRTIDIIQNHLLTLVILKDDVPVAYGHIDFEENKYWFGVCVLREFQNQGLGKLIMNFIFNNEKLKNINEIYLSVDKINANAINLYKQFDFIILNEYNTFYLMKKVMFI
jgi:ribosomal protein S18 acetylase RimI-like enzyme